MSPKHRNARRGAEFPAVPVFPRFGDGTTAPACESPICIVARAPPRIVAHGAAGCFLGRFADDDQRVVVDGPAADGGGVADGVADGLVAVVGRVIVCGTVGGGGEWRSEWIDEWNDEWNDEWIDEWNDQLNHQLN